MSQIFRNSKFFRLVISKIIRFLDFPEGKGYILESCLYNKLGIGSVIALIYEGHSVFFHQIFFRPVSRSQEKFLNFFEIDLTYIIAQFAS